MKIDLVYFLTYCTWSISACLSVTRKHMLYVCIPLSFFYWCISVTYFFSFSLIPSKVSPMAPNVFFWLTFITFPPHSPYFPSFQVNHVLFSGLMWAIHRLKWSAITASAIELFCRKLLTAERGWAAPRITHKKWSRLICPDFEWACSVLITPAWGWLNSHL